MVWGTVRTLRTVWWAAHARSNKQQIQKISWPSACVVNAAQPTTGKTHCAPLTHTPPLALRQEGNHDQCPALGKLLGRSHTQRQPNSAMPTATHRRTMTRPGNPKYYTEDPPITTIVINYDCSPPSNPSPGKLRG